MQVGTGNTRHHTLSWAEHRKRSIVTVQANACHHCQRPVRPTCHLRDGACVDYYRSVIAHGRIETSEDPRTRETVRLLRVERLTELRTCADCWRKPEVQAELKRARQIGEPGSH